MHQCIFSNSPRSCSQLLHSSLQHKLVCSTAPSRRNVDITNLFPLCVSRIHLSLRGAAPPRSPIFTSKQTSFYPRVICIPCATWRASCRDLFALLLCSKLSSSSVSFSLFLETLFRTRRQDFMTIRYPWAILPRLEFQIRRNRTVVDEDTLFMSPSDGVCHSIALSVSSRAEHTGMRAKMKEIEVSYNCPTRRRAAVPKFHTYTYGRKSAYTYYRNVKISDWETQSPRSSSSIPTSV